MERAFCSRMLSSEMPASSILTIAWCRGDRQELAPKMERLAQGAYFCRQSGVFGLSGDGVVVAWESKCCKAKLCPDEARAEGHRIEDQYADLIAEHARRGGRVYKAWLTLPNYPQGRLKEGMRHIYKRFRDRFVRSKKWGIEGALVILEAPLSQSRDWNIHLNVILLTKGWQSFKAMREAWGSNLEIRQHSKFDDRGMHALFAEMVKYSVRAVPEKSSDGKHTAPALIEWEPWEFVEWYEAHHPFRRTRAYGSLHGAEKPERAMQQPIQWLGRIDLRNGRYEITQRGHNLSDIVRNFLDASAGDLDLIRGDKSTTQQRQNGMRGPP